MQVSVCTSMRCIRFEHHKRTRWSCKCVSLLPIDTTVLYSWCIYVKVCECDNVCECVCATDWVHVILLPCCHLPNLIACHWHLPSLEDCQAYVGWFLNGKSKNWLKLLWALWQFYFLIFYSALQWTISVDFQEFFLVHKYSLC